MTPGIGGLLIGSGLLAAVVLGFGLLVRWSVDGAVGDGYSFASAMVDGLRGWTRDRATGPRPPSAEPPSARLDRIDPAPLLRPGRTAGRPPWHGWGTRSATMRRDPADTAETIDLAAGEATLASRVSVRIGFRRTGRPD
jgi:hypothetical protein